MRKRLLETTQTQEQKKKKKFKAEPHIKNPPQGSYGCIYHPMLRCREDVEGDWQKMNEKFNSKDYVMKYMNIKEGEDEWAIAKQLKIADPTFDHTVYITGDSCKPTPTKEYLRSKGCDVIKEQDENKYRGYMLPYGGDSLDEFPDRYPKLVTIHNFWEMTKYLIKGLKKLHMYGIIHNDIKSNNILVRYYPESGEIIPRYIDFGFSFNMLDLSTDDFIEYLLRRGRMPQDPFFISVLDESALKNPQFNLYDALYKSFHDQEEYYRAKYNWKPDVSNYILVEEIFFSGHKRTYIEDIIIPNITKVDIYTLARAIQYTIEENFTEEEQKKETFKALEVLLDHMTHIDVNEQYDEDQALLYMDEAEKQLNFSAD